MLSRISANERLLRLMGGSEHVIAVRRRARDRGIDPLRAAAMNAKLGDEVMTARCLAAADIIKPRTIHRLLNWAHRNNIPEDPGIA